MNSERVKTKLCTVHHCRGYALRDNNLLLWLGIGRP
jgi:hypothetical protein